MWALTLRSAGRWGEDQRSVIRYLARPLIQPPGRRGELRLKPHLTHSRLNFPSSTAQSWKLNCRAESIFCLDKIGVGFQGEAEVLSGSFGERNNASANDDQGSAQKDHGGGLLMECEPGS